jgi:hypothetical protein
LEWPNDIGNSQIETKFKSSPRCKVGELLRDSIQAPANQIRAADTFFWQMAVII